MSQNQNWISVGFSVGFFFYWIRPQESCETRFLKNGKKHPKTRNYDSFGIAIGPSLDRDHDNNDDDDDDYIAADNDASAARQSSSFRLLQRALAASDEDDEGGGGGDQMQGEWS